MSKTWDEKVEEFGEPVPGLIYVCKVKQAWNGSEQTVDMICVDEDDVLWRTADDMSEFDERNWDVISWVEKEQ